MGLLTDAQNYVRYVTFLRKYLQQPLPFDDPRLASQERLARRGASFLTVLERGVYGQRRSPYRALLEHAGITLDDVRRLVADDGVDGTLSRLYDEGVYVTFEEFKARRPIRRGSLEVHVTLADFDNPLVGGHMRSQTGGSGGAPRPVVLDVKMFDAVLPMFALGIEAYGATNAAKAAWFPPPPSLGGTATGMIYAKLGFRLDKFFVTHPLDARARLIALGTAAAIRLAGKDMPLPTLVPPERAHVIARWLAEQRRAGTPAVLACTPSSAVRVCESAAREGLDIAGTLFAGGGEPVTQAKVEAVRAVGARMNATYGMTEVGAIGIACPNPAVVDDCHVMLENVALVERPREVAAGASVDALFCTSMQTLTPKMMLNTETGDYAVLERRDCGCIYAEAGYDLHVHTIRSYEKLTSEGMTFVGDELIRIVEERLPARFGGGPTDYQFVEREVGGRTEIAIRVSPRLGAINERMLVDLVLGWLAAGGRPEAMMARVWAEVNTLRVERSQPYVTGASKVLPIHRLR
jgi:hypothetical protein